MIDTPKCPACGPSAPLSRLAVEAPALIALYRCNGCLGVVANHAAVASARQYHAASHPLMVGRRSTHHCRSCRVPARAGATSCVNCSASLLLSCPLCAKWMGICSVAGIVVDVCRGCELAFFDRGEFAHVCNQPEALRRALHPPQAAPAFATTADVVTDVAMYSEVYWIVEAADVAGSAVVGAGQQLVPVVDAGATAALEGVGEGVLGAAETVGEVSAGAAEVVLEVLGGIFEGL